MHVVLETRISVPGVEDLPEPVEAYELDHSKRVHARGKFPYLGDEKFWIKGVTYGTFKPGEDGVQFPAREIVRSDFEAMSAAGINSIRTYTPPPVWPLDLALVTCMNYPGTEGIPTGRWRIYNGQWDVAPFQSVVAPGHGTSKVLR